MGNKDNELKKSDFEVLFNDIKSKVSNYLDGLKQKSSDEIFNGSVTEAQRLLGQIEPVANEFKNLESALDSFIGILDGDVSVSSSKSNSKEEKPTEAPPAEEKNDNSTPQGNFRIPILKALIYLGGSAKVGDVTEFIERDMKKKFKEGDHSVNGTGDKKWVGSVKYEKDEMEKSGLLSNSSDGDYWEIVQKGIDYLAKHGK